ncbi:hypothetical protein BS47DRAFT_1445964 [Hydnum rufescens UP504]|uniref:HECT-type E3 ubiquitin transferase n=1 Tax=Hydnum rufescens UP504 TaxID=1448309 RepID=A0A9P6DLZ8_9AGAM|nr:hypothetical protein BS47DRAFT_1445964 [Hydnum rufescens UP504]
MIADILIIRKDKYLSRNCHLPEEWDTVTKACSNLIRRHHGLAIFHRQFLDTCLDVSFYKRSPKRKITLFNLEGIDEDPYRGMTWVWENDTTDLVSKAFITTKDCLSGMATTELKPSSADTPVSEENKKEYVEAVIKNHISCHLAKVFDEYEPELLLSGMLHIDVEDWTKFTGH